MIPFNVLFSASTRGVYVPGINSTDIPDDVIKFALLPFLDDTTTVSLAATSQTSRTVCSTDQAAHVTEAYAASRRRSYAIPMGMAERATERASKHTWAEAKAKEIAGHDAIFHDLRADRLNPFGKE